MATPAVVPAGGGNAVPAGGAAAAAAPPAGGSVWQMIGRMMLLYWILQLVMRGVNTGNNNNTATVINQNSPNTIDDDGLHDTQHVAAATPYHDDNDDGLIPRGNGGKKNRKQSQPQNPHAPSWRDGQSFEMYLYFSTNYTLNLATLAVDDAANAAASSTHTGNDKSVSTSTRASAIHGSGNAPHGSGEHQLVWHQQSLRFDWQVSNERALNMTFNAEDTPFWWHTLQTNGTVWTHTYFVRVGHSIIPGHNRYDRRSLAYGRSSLNIYRVTPKISKKVNLMTGEAADPRFASLAASSKPSSSSLPSSVPTEGGKFDDYPEATSTPSAPYQSSDASYEMVVKDDNSNSVTGDEPLPWSSHWRPTLVLRLVQDQTVYPPGLPIEIASSMTVDPRTGQYQPVVYV
jgi:hypothetical protein